MLLPERFPFAAAALTACERVHVPSLPSLLCGKQTAGFQETLTEVEILALIVGCVCHDLDHRGTNNAFQEK